MRVVINWIIWYRKYGDRYLLWEKKTREQERKANGHWINVAIGMGMVSLITTYTKLNI